MLVNGGYIAIFKPYYPSCSGAFKCLTTSLWRISGSLKEGNLKNMAETGIKKVIQNHLSQLQEIGKQTFFETFSGGDTAENMNKYLDEGFSLEKLLAELNNPNSEFSIEHPHLTKD